ncbi:hypothetical protein LZ198_26065 [Myxococcus sp. K15C18031901]|uniref:hypothetical protein n=1 Tax=Myxococcus dinghuensis TaxID=2906761 RepID=UPI0020A78BEB|nr:hypothetical protein [Myxococcus dinghuensis]MCP3102342.1 hypothetical protein [Myxococcus dinghuensis]
MSRPRRPLLWILVALGGGFALCCTGSLGLMALGAFSGSDSSASGGGVGVSRGGTPGEPGGFALDSPQGWSQREGGGFITEWVDRGDTLGVELLRLGSVPGLEDAEGKLSRMWSERIGADWNDVKPSPLVMRRFVANGARAYFTSATVLHKGNGRRFRLSLYLVEAGERLEALAFIQSYFSPGGVAAAQGMMADNSWGTSHVRVEDALKGVRGSPVGLPLVADSEVVGSFSHGSGAAGQWVNTFTGSTTMRAVTSRSDYVFKADHSFQHQFVGGSGPAGAMAFATESDEGTWSVKHDVLTLAGAKRTRRFLLLGAARTPDGKRTLYLMPEHTGWSLQPGAIGLNGELYVQKE